MVTKLQISNDDKAQIVTKLQNLNCDKSGRINKDFFFSKNNFNILTTKEIFEGQRFAILAMFSADFCFFFLLFRCLKEKKKIFAMFSYFFLDFWIVKDFIDIFHFFLLIFCFVC